MIVERFESGLRVAFSPLTGRESVSVGIWVACGNRHESSQLAGISHFIEHMLFKGTATRDTRRIKQEIEGIGGQLNAFTSEEFTCYFVKIPRKHFVRALDVLSDMVTAPAFPDNEIKRERAVILEEIKMYKDVPAQHVQELLTGLLWAGHQMGSSILGTEESVTGLCRNDLIAYKERFYRPANMGVVVCGDLPAGDIVARVAERSFPAPAGPSWREEPFVSRQTGVQTVFCCKETEQTHLALGIHGVDRYSPDKYALAILNTVLGGNMSSRLFDEVREKRGLAYEIHSSMKCYRDTGEVVISAGIDNARVAEAVTVIVDQIRQLARGTVPPEELDRAKEFFIGQYLLSLEGTMSHMLWAGEKVMTQNGDIDPRQEVKRLESVSAGEIRRIAEEIFNPARLSAAFIGPLTDDDQKRVQAVLST